MSPDLAGKAAALAEVEEQLMVMLRRIRRNATERARQVHPDLPPSAHLMLMHVVEHEGIRASDLVEHFEIDKGSVSRQVALLERLGLVERACDPADRRAQTLVVTAEGRDRVAAAERRRRAQFADRLAGWSTAELDEFAAQLTRYNTTLEP